MNIRGVEFPDIEDLGEFVQSEESDSDAAPEEPAEEIADTSAESDVVSPDDTTEETAETPAEEATEAEETPDADLTEKAKNYDEWQKRWAQNPTEFMKAFFGAMSPDQQSAFLLATGQAAPAANTPATPTATLEGLPADYDPASEAEAHYLRHGKALEELPAFAKNVNDNFAYRDNAIRLREYENAVLSARVSALSEALGLKLPDADAKAVEALLKDGKTSIADAVRSTYGETLKKAVKVSKQAAAPRPNTPANASAKNEPIPAGMKSMAEIGRAMFGGS